VRIRSRYLWLITGWTLLVAVLMLAVPLGVRARLPEPIAVEWTSTGTPESSSSLRDFLLGKLVWWLVVAAVWSALVLRGVLRRRATAVTGAALAVFGWVMLGTVVLTTMANLDAPDFRDATELAGEGWLLLGALPVAWVGWRLGGRETVGAAE
jgi:membrane-associated PAP2 superfamily phosphatase